MADMVDAADAAEAAEMADIADPAVSVRSPVGVGGSGRCLKNPPSVVDENGNGPNSAPVCTDLTSTTFFFTTASPVYFSSMRT